MTYLPDKKTGDCAALAMMCRRRALGVGCGARDAPAAATAPRLPRTSRIALLLPLPTTPRVHSSELKAALCQLPGGAVPSIEATARHIEAFYDNIGKPSAAFSRQPRLRSRLTVCGARLSSLQHASACMCRLRTSGCAPSQWKAVWHESASVREGRSDALLFIPRLLQV